MSITLQEPALAADTSETEPVDETTPESEDQDEDDQEAEDGESGDETQAQDGVEAEADGATQGDAEPAAGEDPAAAPIPDPVRTPVPGLIQGLAAILGTTALLIVVQPDAENKVRVTVQPSPGKDEPAVSVQPLQVVGTPVEIDNELLDALADYVPARAFAIATAKQVAQKTVTTAKASATAASAKKTTPPPARSSQRATPGKTGATSANAANPAPKPAPTPKTVALIVDASPSNAVIRATDAKNKAFNLTSSTATELDPGKYILTINASGYQTKITQVTLELGKPQTLPITLAPSAPGLFG